jgi:hypothetical protein
MTDDMQKMNWITSFILANYLSLFDVHIVHSKHYHCSACEVWCKQFGYCEANAWLIVHGTPDESFFTTLGAG